MPAPEPHLVSLLDRIEQMSTADKFRFVAMLLDVGQHELADSIAERARLELLERRLGLKDLTR